METREHCRISKRHAVNWKAAVIFDHTDSKPTLFTQTHDVSVCGTAIHSNAGDLTGLTVTLLLAHTARDCGEVPKLLRFRARVASTVRSPTVSGFRHGLSFVQPKADSQALLAEILGATEPTCPGEGAIAATTPAMQATPCASPGLCQIQHKSFAPAAQREPEINVQLSKALERACHHLREVANKFNSRNPTHCKAYSLADLPNFDGLKWKEGEVDFYTLKSSPKVKLYERVILHFRMSANKKIRVTRESPANEKLKHLLTDNKVGFTTHEERNELGFIVRTLFVIPCEVRASLQLIGDYETGKLMLKTCNIGRFGKLDQALTPEAITDELLDEFSDFILGKSLHPGSLLQRTCFPQ